MRRSAVLQDVYHDQLLNQLGEYIERGWEVHQLVPSSIFQRGDATSVTHWTVVLVRDYPSE